MSDVIVVNEKDEIVGTMPRAEAHSTGVLHRITVVYVENTNDEILVQVRASGKLDHSAAGHVDPGETYLQAALRELSEELSIKNTELTLIGKGNSDRASVEKDGSISERSMHIFEVFVCQAEPGVLAPSEVQKVYWAKPETILDEMKESPEKFSQGFVASLPIYVEWKSKK